MRLHEQGRFEPHGIVNVLTKILKIKYHSYLKDGILVDWEEAKVCLILTLAERISGIK
ncbi:hypothetical protein DB29_02659 [Shouchella clausii]|nr:hypothetical protein DB29_02659 [Shouchella clausii]